MMRHCEGEWSERLGGGTRRGEGSAHDHDQAKIGEVRLEGRLVREIPPVETLDLARVVAANETVVSLGRA